MTAISALLRYFENHQAFAHIRAEQIWSGLYWGEDARGAVYGAVCSMTEVDGSNIAHCHVSLSRLAPLKLKQSEKAKSCKIRRVTFFFLRCERWEVLRFPVQHGLTPQTGYFLQAGGHKQHLGLGKSLQPNEFFINEFHLLLE